MLVYTNVNPADYILHHCSDISIKVLNFDHKFTDNVAPSKILFKLSIASDDHNTKLFNQILLPAVNKVIDSPKCCKLSVSQIVFYIGGDGYKHGEAKPHDICMQTNNLLSHNFLFCTGVIKKKTDKKYEMTIKSAQSNIRMRDYK